MHVYICAQPSTRVITTFAFTRRPTCQGFDTHHPHTWGGIPRGCSPPLCKPTSVQRFGLHTQAHHSHHCHMYAYICMKMCIYVSIELIMIEAWSLSRFDIPLNKGGCMYCRGGIRGWVCMPWMCVDVCGWQGDCRRCGGGDMCNMCVLCGNMCVTCVEYVCNIGAPMRVMCV